MSDITSKFSYTIDELQNDRVLVKRLNSTIKEETTSSGLIKVASEYQKAAAKEMLIGRIYKVGPGFKDSLMRYEPGQYIMYAEASVTIVLDGDGVEYDLIGSQSVTALVKIVEEDHANTASEV